MMNLVLSDRKTQTRRPVDPQPVKEGPFWMFAWGAGWDGSEPLATEVMDKVYNDGSVQPLMFR